MQKSHPIQKAVIIVDHGSRRHEANQLLESICQSFATFANVDIVEPAHMELAEPDLASAFEKVKEAGASHVTVLPFFLSRGRHLTQDIPELCCQAADKFGMSYKLADPIGEQSSILTLLQGMLEDCPADRAQCLKCQSGEMHCPLKSC